ncbi:MAG: polysaccharide deacetylase family protein [Halioglobus sp.]
MKRAFFNVAARAAPLLLGTRAQQRLSILIYHRVLPKRDPMRPGEPTVEEFDWQMRLLSRYFSPLSLVDAVERLQAGSLPDNAICITFDDGYGDNERYAMPVLQKYSIPATVFISTAFLNGGRMWNDSIIEILRNFTGSNLDLREMGLDQYQVESQTQRVAAVEDIIHKIKHLDPDVRAALVAEIETHVECLPNNLMLSDEQILNLARNNVTIGAHTVNHPILSSITMESARSEIQGSKDYLESLLQQSVEVFAYPNGRPDLDYGSEHRELVKELGFKAAVSTHWGVSTRHSDRLQLPRFTPWDKHEWKFALRLFASYRWVDPLPGGKTSVAR